MTKEFVILSSVSGIREMMLLDELWSAQILLVLMVWAVSVHGEPLSAPRVFLSFKGRSTLDSSMMKWKEG
ncbi:semaphorin-3F-like [Arapaima gigas]